MASWKLTTSSGSLWSSPRNLGDTTIVVESLVVVIRKMLSLNYTA